MISSLKCPHVVLHRKSSWKQAVNMQTGALFYGLSCKKRNIYPLKTNVSIQMHSQKQMLFIKKRVGKKSRTIVLYYCQFSTRSIYLFKEFNLSILYKHTHTVLFVTTIENVIHFLSLFPFYMHLLLIGSMMTMKMIWIIQRVRYKDWKINGHGSFSSYRTVKRTFNMITRYICSDNMFT